MTGRVKRERRRPPRARAAASQGVTIEDFAYSPATVSVDTGETVTWSNRDSADHTATGPNFDTGVLSDGQSGSFTFREAGTFAYVCTIHPQMKGTVRVAAAETDEPAPDTEAPADEATGDAGAAPADDSGETLPKSGGEALRYGLLGLLLLGLGAIARVDWRVR